MKPKLRIDAYYDIQTIVTSALENVALKHNIYRCCLNCDNFTEATEICRLANQRPPARVICFGCPKWIDTNEIPF